MEDNEELWVSFISSVEFRAKTAHIRLDALTGAFDLICGRVTHNDREESPVPFKGRTPTLLSFVKRLCGDRDDSMVASHFRRGILLNRCRQPSHV